MSNLLKFIVIYLSIITGTLLSISGAVLLAMNFFNPQGYMFEGAMLLASGITLLLIVMIASTLGKTVMLFDEILNQTTNLYEELLRAKQSRPKMPGSIQSLTITDINTGKEVTTPLDGESIEVSLGKINEAILSEMMKGPKPQRRKKKEMKDMNLKELEKELATAVKLDKFEIAKEINGYIHILKNPPAPDENNGDIL